MKRRRLQSSAELACPFCGEVGSISIDEGGGEHQSFVDDCPVCCKPRLVHLEGEGEELRVWCERAS